MHLEKTWGVLGGICINVDPVKLVRKFSRFGAPSFVRNFLFEEVLGVGKSLNVQRIKDC